MELKNDQAGEDFITLTQFRHFLFHHIVPLDVINDSRGEPMCKTMPYWRKNGLVPFIEKGKWVKISFCELIWLRILDTLREMGYPLEQTKKVAQYFFIDAYTNNLPQKNLEYNKSELLRIKNLIGLNSNEKGMLAHLEELELNPVMMHAAKFDINYLSNLVTSAIGSRKEACILIFTGGEVVQRLGQDYLSHRSKIPNVRLPHIRLSITHYLQEFIESKELSEHFVPQMVNEKEEKVLREMNRRNVRQVTVHLHNGEIKKIDSRRIHPLSADQQHEVRKVLGLRNYEKIEIDTVDRKNFIVYRTDKDV